MDGYFKEKLNGCDSLVCVKGVDIQSLSYVCASFYILIMVFLSFDDFNISLYPSFQRNAWTVTAVIGPMFA